MYRSGVQNRGQAASHFRFKASQPEFTASEVQHAAVADTTLNLSLRLDESQIMLEFRRPGKQDKLHRVIRSNFEKQFNLQFGNRESTFRINNK